MSERTIRLGVVGLDGHGPNFTAKVNGPDSQIAGARVVAAMPVPSVMISEEQLAEKVEATRALGVEIVDDPAVLASKVDGILVLHDDGSKHLELASRCAEFGKPMFVDKPLEVTAAKARKLVETCVSNNCPVFTSSALRLCAEVQSAVARTEDGPIVSAMTYSPLSHQPTMPGWIYYGIHAVEPLYALMGPGCREVRCIPSDAGPVAVGTWDDGRLGIAKAMTRGPHGYNFTVWRETTTEQCAVNVETIYLGLLTNIKTFMETGDPPADPQESIEVIAFMEAANESMAGGGTAVRVAR